MDTIKRLKSEIEELKKENQEQNRKRPRPANFQDEVWSHLVDGYPSDMTCTRGFCRHCKEEINHHRKLQRVRLHLQKCQQYRLSEMTKSEGSDGDTD